MLDYNSHDPSLLAMLAGTDGSWSPVTSGGPRGSSFLSYRHSLPFRLFTGVELSASEAYSPGTDGHLKTLAMHADPNSFPSVVYFPAGFSPLSPTPLSRDPDLPSC